MRRIPPAALLLLLSGCGGGESTTPEQHQNNVVPRAVPTVAARKPPVTMSAEVPFDRLAGITVGEALADVRGRGIKTSAPDADAGPEGGCTYVSVPALPGLALMLDGKRVVRIDVDSSRYPTAGGVRVGMAEREATRRLPKGYTIEAHPYGDADDHYLIVHREGTPHGLILETWNGKVQSYRIGRWDAVQLIEGCS